MKIKGCRGIILIGFTEMFMDIVMQPFLRYEHDKQKLMYSGLSKKLMAQKRLINLTSSINHYTEGIIFPSI